MSKFMLESDDTFSSYKMADILEFYLPDEQVHVREW